MKPIGNKIICRRIKREAKQGLLILPTKTDYNEYKIISLGDRCDKKLHEGNVIRIASHIEGKVIELDDEILYLLSKEDYSNAVIL